MRAKQGAGVELVWSWCGAGVELVWSWCGAGVELVWSWCGAGVELVWSWCGAGVELVWSWCGAPAETIITALTPSCFTGTGLNSGQLPRDMMIVFTVIKEVDHCV
uniref:Uncharacterized protein n=1 Tax=Knipowitschia caucasica TaxID=637954 RepID=A0AAV2MGL7_KNICA